MTAAPPLLRRMWRQAYLLLAVVILCWAGNSIVGRAVRDLIPPAMLACVRWTGASLLVLPLAWPHLRRDWHIITAHWKMTLALGIVGVGAFNTLLYAGLHYTTAANGLLMQSSQSAMILLLGMLLLKERPSWARLGGALLSLAGVITIVAQADLRMLLHLDIGLGEIIILAASACWAMYTVLLHWRPPVHPLSFGAASFIIGVGVTLPFAAAEYISGQRIVPGAVTIGGFAYVVLFPSLIAYLLFNRGVELIGAARTGQFLNLMPLAGALLAATILGEPLKTYHAIGMVMILVGLALFAKSDRQDQGSG